MKSHLFIFSLLLLSCQTVEPISEYNPQTNFKTFQSFSVCDDTRMAGEKYELYDNLDSRKINKELLVEKIKGFGFTYDEISPDLLVSYEIKFEELTLSYAVCRDDARNEPWEGCDIVEYPFTEGTMVLTILDNNFDQIVWISSLEGISSYSNRKQYKKKMTSFISKILSDFPVHNNTQ